MAQSASSLESESSHRSSPPHSMHDRQPGPNVSIESLIAYLVASKRSLSSIHLVHKATTILCDARATVEYTAALIARTKYLRRSLLSQLKTLRGIQFEIEGAAQAVKNDIQNVIGVLEQTDRELAIKIDALKSTSVEEGFKYVAHIESESGNDNENSVKDTLHDFVDDKPVEELKATIQSAIDNAESAEAKMDESMRALEEDLQSINLALSTDRVAASSTSSEIQSSNIPRTFRTLEGHAHEMAVSLESLVKHFDFCVTAIKHTEGAGAIVAKTVDAADLPDGGIEVFYDTPSHALTNKERKEMLSVLENDAAQVDDVVAELSDREAEMQAKLASLVHWREVNEATYNDIKAAFDLLEGVGSRLSNHIAETSQFSSHWNESRLQIIDGQTAMLDLCTIYTQFLDAYDGLIVEVARRRTVKKQMQKIVLEAHRKLEELYEDDLHEREIFRSEQGDYLPSDIWTGLSDLPARFAVQRVDGEESVPELPRARVEEALKRLKGGGRSMSGS